MPYYIPRPRPVEKINLSTNHFVSVIASYNVNGKCVPLYFRYVYTDGTYSDIAVDRVIDTRVTICNTAYVCDTTVNDLKKRIVLTFHNDYKKWTLQCS